MIRLGLLILLLLFSLLTICKAPAYPFWLLAIMVTEYCWVFVLTTILILISGYWIKQYQLSGTLAGLLALLLFCIPIISAYRISATLDDDLNRALNIKQDLHPQAAFSFLTLFENVKAEPYKTITYASYQKPKDNLCTTLTLDFYKAGQTGQRPCIVVIHGGSWSSGDSQQLPELNSCLARSGYNVASLNYRLAPSYHNPAQVEDVKQAISYLKHHALQHHIDTTQFVLLGRSAGGQIALLTAYAANIVGLKGVIDFYGPADMVWGYSKPANPLVFNSRLIMEKYLGGNYHQVPDAYKASSPIAYINRQAVPTLIIHGENDVLVAYEHSTRLNKALTNNGVKHFFLSLPWATHGFDYNLNGPGGQLSTHAVLRFMQAVTH